MFLTTSIKIVLQHFQHLQKYSMIFTIKTIAYTL